MANFVGMRRPQDWINTVLAVLLLISPWVVGYSADLTNELRGGRPVAEGEPGNSAAKDGQERSSVSARPVECSNIFGTAHPAAIYCDD
jgi:hypothetical protein